MNRKGQIEIGAIFTVIVAIIVLSMVLPAITETVDSVSCKSEKATIDTLTGKLTDCQNSLALEQQKVRQAQSGLNTCENDIKNCQEQNDNLTKSYNWLLEEYAKKDQPINQYYFIKVYEDKIIVFNWLILYHIHLFGLFASLGITFSIKFFEVNIHIKVLNKKNQKKLVRDIRNYLADHPWAPVIIMLGLILITNLPQLIAFL